MRARRLRSEFERALDHCQVRDTGPVRAIILPAELTGFVVGAHARDNGDGTIVAGWPVDELLELAAQTLREEDSGVPAIRRRTALFRRLLGADWPAAQALAALPAVPDPYVHVLDHVGDPTPAA